MPSKPALEDDDSHPERPLRAQRVRLRPLAAAVVGGVAIVAYVLPRDPLAQWLPLEVRDIAELWILAALLLVAVVGIERRPLASLRLFPLMPRDVAIAGALAAGLVLIGGLTMAIHLGPPTSQHLGTIATHHSIAFLLALSVSAGICEELLFRGYLLERLEEWSGNIWLAAIGSGALFVAGHWWSWGFSALTTVGPWTALITYAFVRRRRVAINIMAHAASDAFALVLLPLLLRFMARSGSA